MIKPDPQTHLPRTFFNQPTLKVAEELLGKIVVRQYNGQPLRGRIVETEAYIGQADSACHCAKGKTSRTEVMFGEAGHAYVYLVYGMHYMFNIVTEAEGFPSAVLIRAVEPLDGIEQMAALRGKHRQNLSNGPARLCQALAIDKNFNRWDLTRGEILWVDDAPSIPKANIRTGKRVGIGYANSIDQNAPWRFWIEGNAHLSR